MLSGIEICDEKIVEYRRKTLQEEQQKGRAKGKTKSRVSKTSHESRKNKLSYKMNCFPYFYFLRS